jgi:hypothetical protein
MISMPTCCCKPLLALALGASLLLAPPIAIRAAHAQDVAAPSPIEREFWRSTQQIGSEGAYQAYLDRYPNGFFAALASAAIRKGADASSAGSPQNRSRPVTAAPAGSSSSSPAFDPAKIAGPTGSRAITQQTGDIFYGPGPITVGWLGAKKQVLVPTGRWVLLGAEDGLSGHTSPIPLTAMVFARLEESGNLRSLLLVRFNGRSGNSHSTWTDAKACEDSAPSAPFAWHETGSGVTQCVTSALRSPSSAARTFSSSIWKLALQSLTTAGGALPSASYLLTEMFYTGDLSNYMKVTRIDFGVSQDRANAGSNIVVGQAASLDLSIAGRRRWAEAYSPLAAVGYRKKLAEDELYAGTKPMTASALPD